jgi:late competence protein required for DNA uptake (superfamily II DNA/RNA helicase)
MNRLTITKVNESFLEIQGELDILNEIYSRYSEHKAGYLYSMAFKDRRWDGKKHFFNTRNGMLPYGFLPDLLAYCKKNCYEYDLQGVDETKLTRTLDEAKYKESIDYFMRNSGMTIRPYQDDAVKAGLTHKRGILLSCTGSGKSLMIYNIVRALRKENYKHILIIVPTIPLIYQMRDDMIDYGYDDYENELTIQEN